MLKTKNHSKRNAKKEVKLKKCKVCGTLFKPYKTTDQYCSSPCYYHDQPVVKKPKCKPLKKLRKKPKKNLLNKLLDVLWSKAVKILAGNKCEYCGSTKHLNSHHIFGRRNFAVRWEVTNGVCLCSGHHQFDSRFSAHQTPTKFTDWIKDKRGLKWYEELNNKSNTIKPDKDILRAELETIVYGEQKDRPF